MANEWLCWVNRSGLEWLSEWTANNELSPVFDVIVSSIVVFIYMKMCSLVLNILMLHVSEIKVGIPKLDEAINGICTHPSELRMGKTYRLYQKTCFLAGFEGYFWCGYSWLIFKNPVKGQNPKKFTFINMITLGTLCVCALSSKDECPCFTPVHVFHRLLYELIESNTCMPGLSFVAQNYLSF